MADQGEVALCMSSLKRLSEQAAQNPNDSQIQGQMQKLKDEIQEKKRHMKPLEQRIGTADSVPASSSSFEMSQTISKLTTQLNEKAFDLEIKSADNRILQEQLSTKAVEMSGLQDTVKELWQQLAAALEKKIKPDRTDSLVENNEEIGGWLNTGGLSGELRVVETLSDAGLLSSSSRSSEINSDEPKNLRSRVLQQVSEIEILKQEKLILLEEKQKLNQEKSKLEEDKEGLQSEGQQLADKAAFARELALRAVVDIDVSNKKKRIESGFLRFF